MSIRKQQTSYRPAAPRAEGGYWLYGLHAVQAALGNPKRQVRRVVASRNALDGLASSLTDRHPKAEMLEPQAIAKLLPADAVHQGMAVQVMPLHQPSLEEILAEEAKAPLVLLDQVTDPHNVGAILRSAAAFGAKAVVVTAHHSPPEGAVMAKSASGGLEMVPMVSVNNLAQAIEQCKKAGYWCAGLDGEAQTAMHQAKLDRGTALVMGAEGRGLRRLTAERCDVLVKLPIDSRMESLNVSNAAAVALYELSRSSAAG